MRAIHSHCIILLRSPTLNHARFTSAFKVVILPFVVKVETESPGIQKAITYAHSNFGRSFLAIHFSSVAQGSLTPATAPHFEGRINATLTRGSDAQGLRYTVGTNFLRVEMTASDRPYAVDVLDLKSGRLTLLFPHNRSFMRLKNSGAPSEPSTASATAMPAMPPMPTEKFELHDTGQKTNLLGFVCEQYETSQRGETMEIWATEQLFPFEPYSQNQPSRFGPRMIEEQWGALLAEKKLFPLLATLKFDNGQERFRFQVKSVTPQKLSDEDVKLFQPPPDYQEIQPLPF